MKHQTPVNNRKFHSHDPIFGEEETSNGRAVLSARKKVKQSLLQAYVAQRVLVDQGSRLLDTRPLIPGISWYSFLEAESIPGHTEMSAATE